MRNAARLAISAVSPAAVVTVTTQLPSSKHEGLQPDDSTSSFHLYTPQS